MKIVVTIILLMITFVGCSTKNDTLENLQKELIKDNPIAVYKIPESAIYTPNRWVERNIFHVFPFVSTASPFNFQGKFHTDFYDKMNISWNAVALDKVDWDLLSKKPNSYNIIYIRNIGISEVGEIENDFMKNIAKSYNISPTKLDDLKKWIEKGGVLWSEAGITASRFETFYPHGRINDRKTLTLFSKDRGTLFGVPIQYRNLKSSSVDMVNYETELITLHSPSTSKTIQGISKVTFKPISFIESYPVIQSNLLLVDNLGRSYAGYETLGKGVVMTMLPTHYWQADDDGELYRWKLLSWVLQRQGIEGAKALENPKQKQ